MKKCAALAAAFLVFIQSAAAYNYINPPPRRTLGVGPFDSVVLASAMLVDGTDASFRGLEGLKDAPWTAAFTHPQLKDFFVNGGYTFVNDWRDAEHSSWKEGLRAWMQFLKEFHAAGGKIAVGSDAGWMYDVYGFGYVHEMLLLQEAGLSPLDIITSAARTGVICGENPLNDLGTLYATGSHGHVAIQYVMKDGILFDAEQLRTRVKLLVKTGSKLG